MMAWQELEYSFQTSIFLGAIKLKPIDTRELVTVVENRIMNTSIR